MFCPICNQEIDINSIANFFVYHIKKIHNIQTKKEYYDIYIKKDGEGLCVVCGRDAIFQNMIKGYKKHCSLKCVQLDPETKKKKENTFLKRYGVTHNMQMQSTKDKIKQTNLERYGYEHNFKSENYYENIKKVKKERYGNENYRNEDKIKKTNLEKYGCENPFGNSEVKDKIKQTNLTKYGCENPRQNATVQEKIKETSLEKYGHEYFLSSKEAHINISEKIFDDWLNKKQSNIKDATIIKADRKTDSVVMKCHKCNNEFSIIKQMIRLRTNRGELLCNICNPYNKPISYTETEIYNFCKEFVPDIQQSNRKILNNYELDCYSESLKIAIEFNGLYWHSEAHKPKQYHKIKTEQCEEKDIHLIHIYEDDWLYKSEIIKSRLRGLFRKNEVIYARKCVVKKIDNKISKEFCEDNHLQGSVNSLHSYGLYYNDELVSVMTFGSLRINLGQQNIPDNYELLRFCNKLNINVVGGASKLFKAFIEEINPLEIISYADRSWSNIKSNVYLSLGFNFEHTTEPNYSYFNSEKNTIVRENRYKYRKDVLIKEGFDPENTEHDIMIDRGYLRIYDSGQLKYKWKKLKAVVPEMI